MKVTTHSMVLLGDGTVLFAGTQAVAEQYRTELETVHPAVTFHPDEEASLEAEPEPGLPLVTLHPGGEVSPSFPPEELA